MSEGGWIKLHRKVLGNPVVCKDADHLAIWVYLLLNASRDKHATLLNGKKIILQPGQIVTGRKKIANDLDVNEHKVDRVLKAFEIEHQIEQQTSSGGRLISIANWQRYQENEQPTEQQMSNECATSEQRVSTKQEYKELEKERIYTPPFPPSSDDAVEESSLSDPVKEKLREWLNYKRERREAYKPQGLKALVRQVGKKEQEMGSLAVIEDIDASMASGWKGLYWRKPRASPTSTGSDYLERLIRGEVS